MSANSRVLVDTSVWVQFFRGREDGPLRRELIALMSEERAVAVPIVLAELLYGVRGARERSVVRDLAATITVVEPDCTLWMDAGDLGRDWQSRGRTLSIADCLLAATSRRLDVPLWSLDNDFQPLFDDGFIRPHTLGVAPGR